VSTLQITDEQLISRVVAAVLRELGYVDAAPAAPDPEWAPANEVRRTVVKVNRSKWYQLLRRPDFPRGRLIGHTRYLHVPTVRVWVNDQEVI
jgi:hypothetical protein